MDATLDHETRLRLRFCGMDFATPAANRLRVEVAVSVTGKTRLETGHAREAFKTVMLSSMHFAPDLWDTDRAFAGDETRDIPDPNQWIFSPSRQSPR